MASWTTGEDAQSDQGQVSNKENKAPVGNQESDVDGWSFRRNLKEVSDIPGFSLKVARDSEYYYMDHARRGVALIFNHIHFDKMATRNGTVKDCKNLEEVLTNLDFEVRIYTDPSTKTISNVLKATAEEDHNDADCLVVVVMSHGESGFLHSSDSLYPVDTLWNAFTNDKCTTLLGKPKLFFIQACRGERVDQGVKIIHETDGVSTYKIPAYADILVAYSTYDGFYSWRNPDAGSWFVQAICEEFKTNGRSRDLVSMLTFVNRRVALEYQSYVPQNEKMNAMKQMPSFVSMLIRHVHFPPKHTYNTVTETMKGMTIPDEKQNYHSRIRMRLGSQFLTIFLMPMLFHFII